MNTQCTVEVSRRGSIHRLPAMEAEGRKIMVSGRLLRIASVFDEDWLQGRSLMDPMAVASRARIELDADIFTFAERLPHLERRFDFPFVLDNVACIDTRDIRRWWEDSLPQETRKNVRRAAKRGVSTAVVDFDDALLRNIVSINNETPIRQGRPFWHYQKPLEAVKRDYTAFNDRSVYIAAFFENSLIGITKIVSLGEVAAVLQLLCLNSHQDKRPANALIAKAVEVANSRGHDWLVYGKYQYGAASQSPLTEFKRRNGFVKADVPRYYLPLTSKGRAAMACGLHLGVKRFLPGNVHTFLVEQRTRWYSSRHGTKSSTPRPQSDDSPGQTK
jgi:hypothetical protein